MSLENCNLFDLVDLLKKVNLKEMDLVARLSICINLYHLHIRILKLL